MSKFDISYKLGLAVLVLPVLVFVYLVGISAFNNNAKSSATETAVVIPQTCGEKTYEKSSDFSDTFVNIDFSSNKKSISISGLNGWNVVKVWLDVDDDGVFGYKHVSNGPLNNYNPSGDEIEKAKVELYKACPTPTNSPIPTATMVPTPTSTVIPTATLLPTATVIPTDTVSVTPTDKPGQEVCPNTGNGWTKYDNWADEKTEQSHDAGLGYVVTEVCVKGSTDIHYFTEDGEKFCWEVEGIGKQVATASETWANANAAAVIPCHDISHASFKVALVPTVSPTNTPSPTDTPAVTPTDTLVPTATVTPTDGQIRGVDATVVPTMTPVYQARVLAVTGNNLYVPVGVGMIIMGLAMILGTDSVLLKRK